MSDDELVEVMARHSFLTLQADRDVANKWENESSETQRTWRIIARAALAAARPVIRAQALEEAARVADEYQHPNMAMYPQTKGIAAAIRALREKE